MNRHTRSYAYRRRRGHQRGATPCTSHGQCGPLQECKDGECVDMDLMAPSGQQRRASTMRTFTLSSAVRNPVDGLPDPVDQPDVTHTIEPVNDAYNVGAVVRELSQEYLSHAPNKVTAENMVALLTELEDLTDQVLRDSQEGIPGEFGDDMDRRRFQVDLGRWRMRLDYYLDRAKAAAAADPTDRKEILWTVTAPLFLGFYGGPTGTELHLPGHDSDPFTVPIVGEVTEPLPPGFDPTIKHPADLATPFSLANQQKTYAEHKVKILGQLAEDIAENAKELGKTIVFPSRNPYLKYGLIGLGAVAGLYLVTKLS